MDRRLALASLDPNAAIEAAALSSPGPRVIAAPVVVEGPADYQELQLSVEVVEPRVMPWWRFAMFWLLLRLAARVAKFRFEITKAPE